MVHIVRADTVEFVEGNTEAPRGVMPSVEVSPGSESRACTLWGSLGTWEALPPPSTMSGRGTADQNPGPERCVPRFRERIGGAWMVPPSEGNEAKWEGRQGIGVSRTTGEAGEPNAEEPRGGKETPEHGIT